MCQQETKIQKQSSNENRNQSARRLLRIRQIVGDKDNPGILPISKSSWWAGVKAHRFPQPIKLGPRTTAWRSEDIDRIISGSAVADDVRGV